MPTDTELIADVQEVTEQETAQTEPAEAQSPQKKKKRRFPLSIQLCVALGLILGAVILEIIAINSTSFSDWYRAHIYPIWVNTYGRLTSLFPFSFGEILIMIAVFGIPASLLAMIVLLIIKKGRRKKVGKVFGYVYLWIITFVVVVQVNNCFVLYRTSNFAQTNGIPENQHTNEQLEMLGDEIVVELNEAAENVQRDDKGRIVMNCDYDETAKKAMNALGKEFKNLEGYYVTPKPIICSFFMSQMNLTGIYFPFSMEANYNNDCYKAKLPCTVCHELAHTRGYIQEDEATFIAVLACIRSDDPYYRYAGYLTALTYVRNKIFDYASDDKKAEFDGQISDKVWADIDANREYWDSVKEKEDTVFDTQTVSKLSSEFVDNNLKLNGVEDGSKSYGRMVDLMLNYFIDKA
ncbi:MAG: DUF3810 domain-containing protein [Ruminococcus sp.]|nr:DUF3810 domain-containing protein [Ruminococcus sp.]